MVVSLELLGAIAALASLLVVGAGIVKARAMLEARAKANTDAIEELKASVKDEIVELRADYAERLQIVHGRIDKHSERLDQYIDTSVDIKTTLASVQTLVGQVVDRIGRFEDTMRDLLRSRGADRHD